MSKFRSKPVEIEAVQMTKQRRGDWWNMVERKPNGVSLRPGPPNKPPLVLCETRQGIVEAHIDDWIIQESDGSGCYPCKPDVFAAKYERVE